MKRAIVQCSVMLLSGPTFAAPNCGTLVPIAESVYKAIDEARKAKDWAAARSWAAVFWRIDGSQSCEVSRNLGLALWSVSLGSANVGFPSLTGSGSANLGFPSLTVTGATGSVKYRQVRDAGNRTTIAPDQLTINGVQYKIASELEGGAVIDSRDVAKLLVDPKNSAVPKGFDAEALKSWKRFEK